MRFLDFVADDFCKLPDCGSARSVLCELLQLTTLKAMLHCKLHTC